jgi:hypothetical protein
MTKAGMLIGARKLLSVCTVTRPDESVLVVTDPELAELAEPLAVAAAELGAEPTICVMPTRSTHGQEPPGPVAAALAATDVFSRRSKSPSPIPKRSRGWRRLAPGAW